MKRISLYFFLIIAFGNIYAQSWQPLGPDDNWASVASVSYMSMAISPIDDLAYISYADNHEGGKVTVKRFNGSVWETVGDAGFSEYSYRESKLAFSPDGTLYIAYTVEGNQTDINFDVVTVKRFNGTFWEAFDSIVSSEKSFETTFLSLDFSPDGTLYVSYEDTKENFQLTVQKHSGTSWEIIGNAGFTGKGTNFNYADFTFSPSGIPYVAHIDFNNKLRVYRFNGIDWEIVGGGFVTEDRVKDVSITFSPDEVLFVEYQNLQNQNKTEIQQLEGDTWSAFNTNGLDDENLDNVLISYSPDGFLYAVYETPERLITKRYNGSSWEGVGSNGFFTTKSNRYALAFSNTGAPFMVYQDVDNLGKATVVNLRNNEWQAMGTKGISEFYASNSSVAISPDDEPYVAYIDYGNQGRLTVQKYNGSSWEVVGPIGFTDSEVDYISIAFSLDGLPYVAYTDRATQKANVRFFNGNSWDFVGDAGFSDGQVAFTTLKFSPDGIPYVLYKDFSRVVGRATVRRFNGNGWELVGEGGFSEGEIAYPTMAFSLDGSLYVAYSLSFMGYDLSIQKFDGDSWESLNRAGLFDGQSYHTSIAISPDQVPYVVFQNGNAGDANVQLFNGSSWEYVGNRNFTDDGARYASIHISEDGIPSVLYSGENNKITLRQYNGDTWDLFGDTKISNTEAIYPDLAKDSEGNLIVVYASGYVYAKKYGSGIGSNSPPEIVSDTIFYSKENTNEVFDIESIDPDGDTEGDGLTYSFTTQDGGGADNSLFDLNEQTGEITFITSPDYQIPSDVDADNEYTVQITVTDSTGLFDTEEVLIIVTYDSSFLSIIEIAIVNVDDQNDVIILTNNGIVDASLFCGKNWNIVVTTSTDVESVRLELSGITGYERTANTAPYFLFEESLDNLNGDLFENGITSITATPFSDDNLMGAQGESLTIDFEIKREALLEQIIVYPNPVDAEFNIKVSNCLEIREVQIFDAAGRLVKWFDKIIKNQDGIYELRVPTLSSGVYFLKLIDQVGKDALVEKIIME